MTEGSWCSDEAKMKKGIVLFFKWLSKPRKKICIAREVIKLLWGEDSSGLGRPFCEEKV